MIYFMIHFIIMDYMYICIIYDADFYDINCDPQY